MSLANDLKQVREQISLAYGSLPMDRAPGPPLTIVARLNEIIAEVSAPSATREPYATSLADDIENCRIVCTTQPSAFDLSQEGYSTIIRALRQLAAAPAESAEPVAWVMQANSDGGYGAEIAVVGWSTFEKQMDKLRANPWVLAGKAKIVPLYAAPVSLPPEEAALSPSQLEQANVDLATESATLRGVLSELVGAIEAMDNLDEMDGEVFQTNSAALDAAVEKAKPLTEAAMLSPMNSRPLSEKS